MHYLNRGWFFPLALRVVPGKTSSFSVAVIAAGMFVTSMHGYLNATWFTTYGAHLTRDSGRTDRLGRIRHPHMGFGRRGHPADLGRQPDSARIGNTPLVPGEVRRLPTGTQSTGAGVL